MNEVEYIIETKTEKEWQKCLNQWKHDYDINVISITVDYSEKHKVGIIITICLTRKKKVI